MHYSSIKNFFNLLHIAITIRYTSRRDSVRTEYKSMIRLSNIECIKQMMHYLIYLICQFHPTTTISPTYWACSACLACYGYSAEPKSLTIPMSTGLITHQPDAELVRWISVKGIGHMEVCDLRIGPHACLSLRYISITCYQVLLFIIPVSLLDRI